jgi:hypothetical protein
MSAPCSYTAQEVLSLEGRSKEEREALQAAVGGKGLKDLSDIWASPDGSRVFLLSQVSVCMLLLVWCGCRNAPAVSREY